MGINKKLLENFVCQQCGNCCAVDGIVQVSIEETNRIAEFLEISLEEFREKYATRIPGRGWVLLDKTGSDDCIFLTENRKCAIQPVKPRQCVNFPTKWISDDAEEYCEGIKLLLKQSASG